MQYIYDNLINKIVGRTNDYFDVKMIDVNYSFVPDTEENRKEFNFYTMGTYSDIDDALNAIRVFNSYENLCTQGEKIGLAPLYFATEIISNPPQDVIWTTEEKEIINMVKYGSNTLNKQIVYDFLNTRCELNNDQIVKLFSGDGFLHPIL